MPVREQIKTAVVYVGPGQANQNEILANTKGSAEYDEFVQSLGWNVDLLTHRGFAGKVDTKRITNGSHMPYYADDEVEVFFHVATMMPNEEDEQQVSKKRHIGNDMVHIVWSEHDREYLPFTITSDFGDIIIVIYPLKRCHQGLYRIQVTYMGKQMNCRRRYNDYTHVNVPLLRYCPRLGLVSSGHWWMVRWCLDVR